MTHERLRNTFRRIVLQHLLLTSVVVVVIAVVTTTVVLATRSDAPATRPDGVRDVGGNFDGSAQEDPSAFAPSPYSLDQIQNNAALFQEERAKPRFVGWVAGLFIHPGGSEYLDEPGIGGDCGESPATDEQMSQHSEWLPIPDHLPSGAVEVKPPSGTVCPDGNMAVFVRHFRSTSGRFDITRTSGWFYLVLSVSAGRVQEGQLDGTKTVRILPVTPDGYGGYAVIVRTDDGWLGVSSDGLTEDESDRILSTLIARLLG